MLAINTALALLAVAPAGAPAVSDDELSLEPVSEVLFNGQVCGAFGYAVDTQGLNDWAGKRRDLASAAVGVDAAQAQIDAGVRNRLRRIYVLYWREATKGSFPAGTFDERQFRFVKQFRKTCDAMARSQEVGQFFIPPEQPRETHAVIEQMKSGFLRMAD